MLHKSSLTILPMYVLLFSIIHVHFFNFTCYSFLLTLCSFPTPPASLLASWGQRQHLFATAVQLRITSPHTGTVHSCCSVPQLCRTLWDPTTAARQASLSLTISQSLPKFMSTASVCHSTISSSDTLFSFCPQSFPALGTFPVSWLFALDDQNAGVSAIALWIFRVDFP